MLTNEERVETITEGMAIVLDACEKIRSADNCGDCPVHCIEADEFYTIADCVTKERWSRFFELAEMSDGYMSLEDQMYDLADMQRKGERDEWYD